MAVFQVRRHRTTPVATKAEKPGRAKRRPTEEALARPTAKKDGSGGRRHDGRRPLPTEDDDDAERRRRRQPAKPPASRRPTPRDRIRTAERNRTSTATDARRPAPIDELPTPTKACLPPMLHLPCLLTESD